MLRGEIRLVDFDPARPGEVDKARPAVIVSNDEANATAARLGRGVITVVPLSRRIDRVYPFQVLLPKSESGLQGDSKAQAEHVRSLAVYRVKGRVGAVPHHLMEELDGALRLHLELG